MHPMLEKHLELREETTTALPTSLVPYNQYRLPFRECYDALKERDAEASALEAELAGIELMDAEGKDFLPEHVQQLEAEVERLRAIVEELRRRLDAVDKLLLEALDVSEGISPEGKEFDDALAAKATKEDD